MDNTRGRGEETVIFNWPRLGSPGPGTLQGSKSGRVRRRPATRGVVRERDAMRTKSNDRLLARAATSAKWTNGLQNRLQRATLKRKAFSVRVSTQQTQEVDQMLFYCWVSVEDGGPTLKRDWVNLSCWLGNFVCDY